MKKTIRKSDQLSVLHTDSNLESTVAGFFLGISFMSFISKGPVDITLLAFILAIMLFWIARDRHRWFHRVLVSRTKSNRKKHK